MPSLYRNADHFIMVGRNYGNDTVKHAVAALSFNKKLGVWITGQPVPIDGDFVDALMIVRALNTELKARRRKERRRKEN